MKMNNVDNIDSMLKSEDPKENMDNMIFLNKFDPKYPIIDNNSQYIFCS